MTPPHLLLLFHHYRTPAQMGGLRSWHIGTHLAGAGFRVTAIVPGVDTLSGVRHPRLAGKLWHREVIDGAAVVRANSLDNDRRSKPRRALYYLTSSLCQALAATIERRVDLVACTSMPVSSMISAWLQSVVRRVPLVVDVRDLVTDAAMELGYFSRGPWARAILAVERWVYERAAAIICVSEGMADLVRAKGIDPARIAVVPIGYDGEDVYHGRVDWTRDVRAELGLTGKRIVLYAGTMGHVIDIPTVLEAARRTRARPDIAYVLVGGGQRVDEYRRTAAAEGLPCVFLGPRPKMDIPLFCAQADMCVYPLQGGAVIAALLGNKIFDYLGNGAATIYTGPSGDVQQLIDRSGGGVCLPAGDAQGMADAIVALADDGERRRAMGEVARAFVRAEYGAKKLMGDFELIVRRVLDARGAGGRRRGA